MKNKTEIVNSSELNCYQSATSESLIKIIEGLRGEVTELKRQVSQLQQNSQRDRQKQFSSTDKQSDLLNRQQLAERLGVAETTILQHETDGKEFVEWSQNKDPEKTAWKYAGADLFEQS